MMRKTVSKLKLSEIAAGVIAMTRNLMTRILTVTVTSPVPPNKSLERTRERPVPSPYVGARAAQLNR